MKCPRQVSISILHQQSKIIIKNQQSTRTMNSHLSTQHDSPEYDGELKGKCPQTLDLRPKNAVNDFTVTSNAYWQPSRQISDSSIRTASSSDSKKRRGFFNNSDTSRESSPKRTRANPHQPLKVEPETFAHTPQQASILTNEDFGSDFGAASSFVYRLAKSGGSYQLLYNFGPNSDGIRSHANGGGPQAKKATTAAARAKAESHAKGHWICVSVYLPRTNSRLT